MRKLVDLRNHILANVPELQQRPEKLLTFIEDGNIEYWQGTNLSHNYTLPVRIIVTDYCGDIDQLIVPILSWLSYREPGLEPKNTIRFEAEMLSNDSFDLSVTVNITERVIVTATQDGLQTEHVLPEPPMEMDPDAQWEIITDLHGLTEPVPGDD